MLFDIALRYEHACHLVRVSFDDPFRIVGGERRRYLTCCNDNSLGQKSHAIGHELSIPD